MTNVSNVYLALKDLGVRVFRTAQRPLQPRRSRCGRRFSDTDHREVSWPTTSSSASSRSGLKRLSMYSLANVLGTDISS